MSETKHTPGPWHVVENDDGILEIRGPNEEPLFTEPMSSSESGCWSTGVATGADFALAAAAPDLLATLQRIAEWRDIDESQGAIGAHQHVRNIARAAIAKATADS